MDCNEDFKITRRTKPGNHFPVFIPNNGFELSDHPPAGGIAGRIRLDDKPKAFEGVNHSGG